MSSMQTDTRCWSTSASDGRHDPWICVSSAYASGCSWCRRMSCSKSAVYSKNRIGPRTEPFGTAYRTSNSFDLVADKRTYWVWLFKYDANQAITDPPRPYEICNRWSSVAWLTLSKAADRSSNVKTAISPESSVSKISDKTKRVDELCMPSGGGWRQKFFAAARMLLDCWLSLLL